MRFLYLIFFSFECPSFMIYLSLIDWITNASKIHLTSLAPWKRKSSSSFRFETIFSTFSLFVLFCSPTALNTLYDAINKSYRVTRWIMSVETTFLCACVRVCLTDMNGYVCVTNILLCFVTRDMDLHITYFLSFFHLFILWRKVFTSPIFEDHRMNAATVYEKEMWRGRIYVCVAVRVLFVLVDDVSPLKRLT